MHDTRYETNGGRLSRIVDRNGGVHAEFVWSAPHEPLGSHLDDSSPARAVSARDAGADQSLLVSLTVTGAVVDGAIAIHPLLGPAHRVGDTAMTALVWARPTEIPAIAEPGRLPFGAGGAIVNAIAVLAQRAGVSALRYAGPYPTSALWRTLARSFRTTAREAEFTADVLDRAMRVARDPIAIDFAPAPHERIAIPGGFVELRDRIERAVLDGIPYEPDGSPARLVDGHCEVWFGDAPYARIATLSPDGELVDGPRPIPASDSAVVGREFPSPLRVAIAELVAEVVPAPLATAARELVSRLPLHWADLGARAASERAEGFAVHAALWDRIAPLGLERLALALAEALAPVVTTAVSRRAAAAAAVARGG